MDDLDRRIINNLQGGFPVSERPFLDAAQTLGIGERDLISRIEDRSINPGKVFDLTLPLDQAAEGYRAMDERRAIKTLLWP